MTFPAMNYRALGFCVLLVALASDCCVANHNLTRMLTEAALAPRMGVMVKRLFSF